MGIGPVPVAGLEGFKKERIDALKFVVTMGSLPLLVSINVTVPVGVALPIPFTVALNWSSVLGQSHGTENVVVDGESPVTASVDAPEELPALLFVPTKTAL
jgi:hypothetical protein